MDSVELYNDGIGKVELVDHVGNDLTIVNSARVSFGTHKTELDDRDRKLIRYLIKHRHTSTLEHCFITFRVKVPLFIRSQHHRHRTWSYNEISRRYTEENLEFYSPKTFRTQHPNNRQASNNDEQIDPIIEFGNGSMAAMIPASQLVNNWHMNSVNLYNKLIEAGVCREQARGVLPQNLYTSYYASCNLNNLIKFIDLRSHEGAQWEIVQVAKAMQQIAEQLFPETMSAYKEIRGEKNG